MEMSSLGLWIKGARRLSNSGRASSNDIESSLDRSLKGDVPISAANKFVSVLAVHL